MVPIFINGHKIYDPPFFLPKKNPFSVQQKTAKVGESVGGEVLGRE